MIKQLVGFHIEPTNLCTLKCPRCARTTFIEKFPKEWRNYQLNLNALKQFMDIDVTDKKFSLCGNTGDPIYYSELFDLINWIHQRGAHVHITTNGSYRTEHWWKELAELMSKKDSIAFSIDGSPENFTQYRINGDWDSIELGIRTMRNSQATTQWKYIPFSFNEQNIEQTRCLSLELGIDQFVIDPSDRWDGETDQYKPATHIGTREQTIKLWHKDDKVSVDPLCKKMHNMHYISADGFYMPCCYVGDYRFYYKSEFYKKQSQYDIHKTTISEVLASAQEFYDEIEKTSPSYCAYNCPKL
jgi:MoaA/NifB/PqqE/SkfB family radical SAM enzyme